MSKPHAKTPQPEAETAAQQTSAAATDSGSAALVQPAPPGAGAAPAPDEHHGHGGLYTAAGGQRTLAERTQAADNAGTLTDSANPTAKD